MPEPPTQFLSFSDTIGFGSIVLALILWVFAPKIGARAVGMTMTLAGTIYLVYRSSFSAIYSLPIRHTTAATLFVLITSVCSFQLRSQWRESKFGATEGNLRPARVENPQPFITVQIGQSGVMFVWLSETGGEHFKFAYDAGLRVSKGKHGLEVSTPVRDRGGNLVGEVIANHWKVYPPYCSDKNYDTNSLEIKDGAGHVVLQITLFEDKVQLQGEWRTPFGKGQRLKEAPGGDASITVWPDLQSDEENQELIAPKFRYPSSKFLGIKTS